MRVSRLSEYAALALAVCSLLLAFAALGPVPGNLVSNPFALKELGTTLLVLLGGALLAFGLSRRSLLGGAEHDGPVHRAALAAGAGFEHADAFLRRWASAGLALLILAALFGWLMLSRNM